MDLKALRNTMDNENPRLRVSGSSAGTHGRQAHPGSDDEEV